MFKVTIFYANGKSETLAAHHIETIEGNVILVETETGFRRIYRDAEYIVKLEITFDK